MEESPTRTDDTVLRVQNAEVIFGMDQGESKVLDDVSINVRRQETLGIVGESGSGKSMFADSLLDAVVDPGVTRGDITYYPDDDPDEPVSLLSLNDEELKQLRWEEISMVFQGALSSFNPTLTVGSHFEDTLEAHGSDIDEGMDHARELLADLYLEPTRVLDAYPHELSGGMKQRALIALSLILEPEVLVMDEPTAALDLLMQRSILSLLGQLQDEYELTVIFITHDLPLVAGLADRLAVMYAFKFVETGPTREVVENPTHPYTRALLKAVPNLDAPLSEMKPIKGMSPAPLNVPDGCSYHPRCPLADNTCRNEVPPFHDVAESHQTACFHWEASESEIPLSFDSDDGTEMTNFEGQQSEDPVVSLQDVEVHFQDSESGLFGFFREPDIVRAVDGIDLDIYENDVVALVGESGCGKTTLGKTVVAGQRPTGGTVEFREQEIWKAKDSSRSADIPFEDIRRSLQIIHQDPGASLNPNRTIQSTLADPLHRWHADLDSEDRRERIFGMIKRVGMTPPEDYANRYPHQLSGGEKQRVALIRALLMNPDLILADEAVSALDVSLRVEMMDLMLELQDQFDTSFLFISHNLSNARYFAGKAGGRIGVMYLGEIVEIGPAEEIINDPQHPYTKVLIWSTADLQFEHTAEEPPVRSIDIPDPVDPPAGCRFHTRCPEAREVCRKQTPTLEKGGDGGHETACFREYGDDHPYWDSEPLTEDSFTSPDVNGVQTSESTGD